MSLTYDLIEKTTHSPPPAYFITLYTTSPDIDNSVVRNGTDGSIAELKIPNWET